MATCRLSICLLGLINVVVALITSIAMAFLLEQKHLKYVLGRGGFDSGAGLVEDSTLSLFVFLVVLLLIILLVVVRRTGRGAVIVSEKR